MNRPSPLMPDQVHAGDRTFTWRELVALTSARAVRTAISRGEVARILPGRYSSSTHRGAFVIRAHAATAAAAAPLTGGAALFAAGVGDRAPATLDVAVDEGRRVSDAAWLRAVRIPHPVLAHEWRGILVAEAPLAAVHLWNWGWPERGMRTPVPRGRAQGAREAFARSDPRPGILLSALQRRVITPDAVREAMAATPRIRDRRGLRDVLQAFEAGAESYLELEGLTRTFAGAGFSRFLRQHRVIAGGRYHRLDMYDPATRTAVELDGDKYHAAGEYRERDLRRDADLATVGIQTVRLPYRAVVDEPDWCRMTVRAVLRERERQQAA